MMLSKPEKDQTLKYELRSIGVDPGEVNLGICLISYWGEKLKKDAKGQFVTVPQFKILNEELLDLKRSISYEQHPEKTNIVRNKFDMKNGNMPMDGLIHMGDRLSLMLSSKQWLHESYRSLLYENGEKDVLPAIVSEVQCGFIKNHELNTTVIGHLIPWILKSCDRSKGIEDREILARQKKYSLLRGKGDEYEDRKEDSEEIARKLYEECGMTRELIFLNALKAARKRDMPNAKPAQIKANDVTDAILLALSDARIRHAALMKQLNIKANVEVIEEEHVLPTNEFFDREDDSDEDALFPKKVRKKRGPNLKKRAEAVNTGFEEQAKKRKRVTLPKDDKPIKKKKRVAKKKGKIVDEDDEDTVEVDEDDPIIIIKSTAAAAPKKKDVAKKYKQLTFV